MSVNLLFKIAAVGILVSVLTQVLKHSGRGGSLSHKSCGTSSGAFLGDPLYQRTVCQRKRAFFPVGGG